MIYDIIPFGWISKSFFIIFITFLFPERQLWGETQIMDNVSTIHI